MNKIIAWTFYIMLFTIPLALFPFTSEIFEFNKIVLLYTGTTLISAFWMIKSVKEKRFIFRKTLLDIPFLIFLLSQIISTLLSLDFRTSLLGYYSRFHGGLAPSVCYAILYWAWVANMDKRNVLQAIRALLYSSVIVSLYGIAQHWGIDKDIWTQDVQNRIFSSLGQPNWLAAWVVALMPLMWVLSISKVKYKNEKIHFKNQTFWPWVGISLLLFITLLFTKSRSGILAFFAALIIHWGLLLFQWFKKKQKIFNFLYVFLIFNFLFFISASVIGTPWTPGLIKQKLQHQSSTPESQSVTETVLETGGTESGEIRKIVWQGAIDIWKAYPVFGTGVETFAFAYYQFKPPAHNLTSEWDYLYNKAHNEYLNYLATTGVVGLGAYLVLIFFSLYQIFKNSKNPKFQESKQISKQKFENFNLPGDFDFWSFGVLAGYISILITNFFGFSVVPVALLFFLFPAFAATLTSTNTSTSTLPPITLGQKVTIPCILLLTSYILLSIGRYWYADYLFAQGKLHNLAVAPTEAIRSLDTAIFVSPNEAIYWDERAKAQTTLTLYYFDKSMQEEAEYFAQSAINDVNRAEELSPANVNIKRSKASLYTKLSGMDPNHLLIAHRTLIDAIQLAPTDPKLQYSLAASYYRLGDLERAIEEMIKSVNMRPMYKDSRLALALMYLDAEKKSEAKVELDYILQNIDPHDELAKKELDSL